MLSTKIPSDAQKIVDYLIEKKLTVSEIANHIGVSKKTIYRIRNGFLPLPRTHVNLIQLYLRT